MRRECREGLEVHDERVGGALRPELRLLLRWERVERSVVLDDREVFGVIAKALVGVVLEAIGFLSVESGVELLSLRASLREHHHQYPEKHGEADEARDLPAPARHERERAEERGHQVDQEDGLLVREPDVEK